MSSPPNPSSNKRLRTSSRALKATTPNPAPREPIYNADFPKTDSSDLILESSTGFHFAIARLFLQASSTVFRDTLLVGVDGACERIDGLPIIKLGEDEEDLQRFLSFVQPDPSIAPLPSLVINKVGAVLEMAYKYNCPLTGRLIAGHYLPLLVAEASAGSLCSRIDILGLALIYAQFCDRFFFKNLIKDMGVYGIKSKKIDTAFPRHDALGAKSTKSTTVGWRTLGIHDMNRSISLQVP